MPAQPEPSLIEAPRGRIPVPPIDQKWHERLNVLNVSLLLFIVAVFSSVGVLRGSGRDLYYAANIRRFLANFFPPDFSVMARR